MELFTIESIAELDRFIKKIKSSTTDTVYKNHLECLLLRLTTNKKAYAKENLELQFYHEAMVFYKDHPFDRSIEKNNELLLYLKELQLLIKDLIFSEEISKTIFLIEERMINFEFEEIGRIDIFYANYSITSSNNFRQVAFASWNIRRVFSPFFLNKKIPFEYEGIFRLHAMRNLINKIRLALISKGILLW